MSVFEVAETFEFHWTPEFLIRIGMQPLIAGDTVTWRFQYLDANGAAVDLSDYSAAWLVTQFDAPGAPVVWSRKSGVLISGSTNEIDFDADQSAESTDSNGDPIGRGWFGVNHRREDETALLAVIQTARLGNLRLRPPNDLPFTLLRGDVKVVRPRGLLSDLPDLP